MRHETVWSGLRTFEWKVRKFDHEGEQRKRVGWRQCGTGGGVPPRRRDSVRVQC